MKQSSQSHLTGNILLDKHTKNNLFDRIKNCFACLFPAFFASSQTIDNEYQNTIITIHNTNCVIQTPKPSNIHLEFTSQSGQKGVNRELSQIKTPDRIDLDNIIIHKQPSHNHCNTKNTTIVDHENSCVYSNVEPIINSLPSSPNLKSSLSSSKDSNDRCHSRIHTIKTSKPIPCPNFKNKNSNNNNNSMISQWDNDGSSYERDVAYYDRATWMMYQRIMNSRIKKQQHRHHHHRYQYEQKEDQQEPITAKYQLGNRKQVHMDSKIMKNNKIYPTTTAMTFDPCNNIYNDSNNYSTNNSSYYCPMTNITFLSLPEEHRNEEECNKAVDFFDLEI